MNDQLNDAFETYFPKFGVLIRFVYRLFSLLVLIGLKLRIMLLPEADRRAVAQVSKWLRRGGQLLVTVPFGKPEVTKKHRIYDIGRLKYLFSDFKWVQQRFFERVEGAWVQSSAEKLKNVASSTLPPNDVAILDLERK